MIDMYILIRAKWLYRIAYRYGKLRCDIHIISYRQFISIWIFTFHSQHRLIHEHRRMNRFDLLIDGFVCKICHKETSNIEIWLLIFSSAASCCKTICLRNINTTFAFHPLPKIQKKMLHIFSFSFSFHISRVFYFIFFCCLLFFFNLFLISKGTYYFDIAI